MGFKKFLVRKGRSFWLFVEVFYPCFLIFLEALRLKNPYWLPTIVMSTFRYYLYAPIIILLILAAIDRKWKSHILVFISLGMFLFLYGRLFLPKKNYSSPDSFSIMTFNIQGENSGGEGIAFYLEGETPDILALQEIEKNSPLLDDLKKQGYSVRHKAYYENSNMGMALALKTPFEWVRVLRKTYHDAGKWSYLFSEIIKKDREGKEIQRFNLVLPHLLPFGLRGNPFMDLLGNFQKVREKTYWQIQESQALVKLVHGFQDPTIMLGDFNSTPEQILHTEIRKHMRDAWLIRGFGYGGTRKFGVPLRIDYIYVSPHFEVLSIKRGPEGLSDHRSVKARVQLVN